MNTKTNLNHVVILVALFLEGRGADLAALITQVHAEQLSLPAGVAPGAYAALVHHARFDCPSEQ